MRRLVAAYAVVSRTTLVPAGRIQNLVKHLQLEHVLHSRIHRAGFVGPIEYVDMQDCALASGEREAKSGVVR